MPSAAASASKPSHDAAGVADITRRVAIVGRGLIGGSIERAAAERAPAIGIVTVDRGDELRVIAGADLVVLAAPVLENIRLLPAIAAHLSPTALVTDTGSTKAAIVAAAAGMRFIGGHPIAGGSRSGHEAASADLFAGRRWILTPSADTSAADLSTLTTFVETLGARVVLLDAAEHDRILALVSHLPQLAVSALMHTVGSQAGADGLALAGPGLRDATRLAASAPDIWRDILATNRVNLAAALDLLIGELGRMRDDPGGEQLATIFRSAAAWKQRLDDGPI